MIALAVLFVVLGSVCARDAVGAQWVSAVQTHDGPAGHSAADAQVKSCDGPAAMRSLADPIPASAGAIAARGPGREGRIPIGLAQAYEMSPARSRPPLFLLHAALLI